MTFFTLSRYDLIPRFEWSIERFLLTLAAVAVAVLGAMSIKHFLNLKKYPLALLFAVTTLPHLYWILVGIIEQF